MKTLTRLLLTTLLLLLPTISSAYDFEADGIYYNILADNTCEVTYDDNKYEGDIVIPATANGYTVTGIGNFAFNSCGSLTSTNIPDGVTSIGIAAFQDCTSLASINIPEGVTSIRSCAFSGCTSLTSIIIPEGVTSIEFEVFYNCASLTSINIPEGVTSIEFEAFYNCASLTSINIPEGVTSIEDESFSNCESLTSINIPEGVTSIGISAFSHCTSLTSINIPKGVTSIGDAAFSRCNNLTDIRVAEENSHYTAMDGVLYDKDKTILIVYPSCKGEYSIPEGVTSIGGGAFSGCSSLTSINIPESVTSIGGSAFSGCTSLTSIIIPEGVTSIGGWAFSGCTSLTSINIPEAVTSIAMLTFYNCSSLTSIIIPEEVTSIGDRAFGDCISLTSINIPEGVTSIENSAFSSCSSLTSINIPEGVTSIGWYAFCYCSSLTQCICHATVPPYTGKYAFLSIAQDAILYVPRESIDAYKEADEWGNRFAQILAIEDMDIEQPVELEGVSIDIAAYQWQFLCFPFDVKCSEIGHENGRTQFVVHYYDGAGRAEHGKGDTAEGGTISNWQLVEQDAVIAAGTGFILQHNAESGSEVFTFTPCGNELDTQGDITLPLAENYSAAPNNRGWNLTGNPYPYPYDMRHSDFTSAVTIWNGEGYDALSPVDDEVVLQPYQAFFVQRWDKEAITFKAQAPSPVPPRGEAVTNDSDRRTGTRTLINLAVHALPHGEGRGGGFEGNGVARTRIVLNDLSSRDYEVECDAAKFFGSSIDLYTIEGGIAYAINERPLDDGIVSVGFSSAKAGTYTITADRPVTLIDKQLGITTVLGLPTGTAPSTDGTTPAIDGTTALSAYTFTAPAGNTPSRFELHLGDATCITPTPAATSDRWHTMSGVQLEGKPTKRGIYIRNGRKVAY